MTTEEMVKEVRTMEAVSKELAASTKELASLQNEAQSKVTEIMGDIANRPDWTEQVRQAAIPASNKQLEIDRLTKELGKLKAASRWESSQAIRQPVIDMFRTVLIDNPPVIKLSAVKGTIEIKDGKAVVTLKPTFSSFDVEGLQNLVAAEVDIKAFSAAELTSMDLAITDIGSDNKIDLTPHGEGLKSKGGATGITRSKTQEYLVNGSWLSPKDFIQHLINIKDTVAMTRIQGFSSAATTGSGAAPIAAKQAERLGIQGRDAEVQRRRK